jgi:hypothetical protein
LEESATHAQKAHARRRKPRVRTKQRQKGVKVASKTAIGSASRRRQKRRQSGVKNGPGPTHAALAEGSRARTRQKRTKRNKGGGLAHARAHAKLKANTRAHKKQATKQDAAVATQNSKSPAVRRAYPQGLSNHTRTRKGLKQTNAQSRNTRTRKNEHTCS